LYIGDPVTETHTWSSGAASGSWSTGSNWTAAGSPGTLWDAKLQNTSANDKTALVSANSTIYQMSVSASSAGWMNVKVLDGATLTTFGETRIDAGGVVEVSESGRLDSQFVNIYGGTLAGRGTVFVGSGPVNGVVRNLSGRVAPGDPAPLAILPIGQLSIIGDFSNGADGTLAIDLAGTSPITQYDRLAVDRLAFLGGTLQVSLNAFTPSIGNTFTILTAGQGVSGRFESLLLPDGLNWKVIYDGGSVQLVVGNPGDFNQDGTVNAADYVVWRDTGGGPQNYLIWRSRFGMGYIGVGSGTSDATAVPEPTACVLLMLGAPLAGGIALGRNRLNRLARSSALIRCAALSST
jgi:hypothetical protein